MSTTIRPFTDADYPAIAAVYSAVYPNEPITADAWRFTDEHRYRDRVRARWVGERYGHIVAVGQYDQYSDMYDPHQYRLVIMVHPDSRGQGIGGALYEQASTALLLRHPRAATTKWVPEDDAASIHFLQTRDFHEYWRMWESHLDVRSFEPTPFAQLEPALRGQGIAIRTFANLESDPERNHKLYELDRAASKDIPSPQPITVLSYDQFVEATFEDPNFVPEAFFIATHNDAYIGMSYATGGEDGLDIVTTVVHPSVRRRGIATALKLRGILFAKEHGYQVIRTWNDPVNTGILAINDHLGCVRQPAVLMFRKDYEGETQRQPLG